MAQICRNTPELFDAVRSRRLLLLRDARDLANGLRTSEERAEALRLRDADPWAPIARLIADVHTLYSGPMEIESKNIADESVDLKSRLRSEAAVPQVVDQAAVLL